MCGTGYHMLESYFTSPIIYYMMYSFIVYHVSPISLNTTSGTSRSGLSRAVRGDLLQRGEFNAERGTSGSGRSGAVPGGPGRSRRPPSGNLDGAIGPPRARDQHVPPRLIPQGRHLWLPRQLPWHQFSGQPLPGCIRQDGALRSFRRPWRQLAAQMGL